MNRHDEICKVAEEFKHLPASQLLPTLVAFLNDANQYRREAARWLLAGQGESVISILVREAFERRNAPRHCVRILEVLEAIGKPLGNSDFMTIAVLLRSGRSQIREKVHHLLWVLREARLGFTTAQRA